MISFENDYTTGAHPRLLECLFNTNLEPLSGYGSDPYCERAYQKIRTACSCPYADIFFLVGGTQTNSVIISALLKEYEGVLSAQTGHINIHEAGAIESTGHKVLSLPQSEGKVQSEFLEQYLQQFYQDASHDHMVFPGMLYISYPTEYGTLYSKKELADLYHICRHYKIPLFIDGARLGYGLMSRDTDVTLSDLAALCDVFYIGGTKVGALCGEAVVFPKHNMPEHFLTTVKRRGALLAKGRLLGIQFDALFTDDLYFEISRHAIDMAHRLKKIFKDNEIPFYLESPTNQQFVILENKQMEELQNNVRFSFWEKYDENHTVVRFVTSWSTSQNDLDMLARILKSIKQ